MSRLIRYTLLGFTIGLLAGCTTGRHPETQPPTSSSSTTSSSTSTTSSTTSTTIPPTTTTTRPNPAPQPIRPAATPADCLAAENALRTVGATDQEIRFALPIADRESNCTLTAIADRPSTGDYSWGPWQINYYGNLYDGRVALLGTPDTNTVSWESAASNFLTLLRTSGQCHWSPPNYCA